MAVSAELQTGATWPPTHDFVKLVVSSLGQDSLGYVYWDV